MGPRAAGAGAALLLLLTGCGAAGPGVPAARPPAPAPAAAPAPAPPVTGTVPADDGGPAGPCTGDTLDVSATARRPAGGTGSREGAAAVSDLVFRNTGTAACVLDGYPGVAFVAGNEGTRVGPRAAIDGPRARVRLAPGAAATAPLRVRATESYAESDCVPRQARGLRVAPPGGSGGTFVPRPGPVCSAAPDEPQTVVGSVVPRR